MEDIAMWLHFAATHHGAIIFAIIVTVTVTILFLRNRRCPSCGGSKFVQEKVTEFPLMVSRRLATDTLTTRCRNPACGRVLDEVTRTRQPTKIELLGLG